MTSRPADLLQPYDSAPETQDSPLPSIEALLGSILLPMLCILPALGAAAKLLPGPDVWNIDGFVGYLSLWVGFLGAALAAGQNRRDPFGFAFRASVPQLGWLASAVSPCVVLCLYWAALRMVSGDVGSSFRLGPIPLWVASSIVPVAFALICWRFYRRIPGGAVAKTAVAAALLITAALGFVPVETRGWLLVPGIAMLLTCLPGGASSFVVLSGLALLLFFVQGTPTNAAVGEVHRLTTNRVFPAIPLFALTGILVARSGMADRLNGLFRSLFGRKAAPLADLTSLAILSALGHDPAAALKPADPQLPARRNPVGYGPISTMASLAARGLGVLLPPSLLVALAAGWMALPAAGTYRAVLPYAALVFLLACALLTVRTFRRHSAVVLPVSALAQLSNESPFSLRTRALWEAKGEVLLLILAPVLFLSNRLSVVEAASILTLATLAVTLSNGDFKPAKRLGGPFAAALSWSGALMLLLFSALAFNGALAYRADYFRLQAWVGAGISSPLLFMIVLNLVFVSLLWVTDVYTVALLLTPALPYLAGNYGLRGQQLALILLVHVGLRRSWANGRGDPLEHVSTGAGPSRWWLVLFFSVAALAASLVPLFAGLLPLR